MAAVAASQVPEGLRGLDHEQFAEPGTSRFTAVNGRGSPATAMKTKNPNEETTKAANDESNIRPSQSGDRRGRQASPGPPQQDEHEQRSTTIENHSYPSNNSRSPSSQRAKSTKQSPLKRKRSDSEEFENSRGPPYHGHGFPTGVETQSAPSPEASMARVTPSDHPRDRPATEFQRERERERERVSPESYLGPPSMSARAYEPQHERPQPLSSEYNPHAQTTQQERPYYTHHHDTSDVRLVEALQRENHSYRQGQIRDHYGSPDDDEQRRQQYAEYNTNRSSVSGADADRAKRRKRVFSNRTKTGCMTCRKRKKKCDEAHPECKWMLLLFFECQVTNAYKVIIAIVAALFAKAIQQGTLGRNLRLQKHQSHCNRRQVTLMALIETSTINLVTLTRSAPNMPHEPPPRTNNLQRPMETVSNLLY